MIPDHLTSQINTLPRATGVYQFRDRQGRLLYVGKSKELRTRVTSYFRGDPHERETRLQRMIHDIHSIEHLHSSSELLALLLEDSLIKRGDPIYNLRQNKYRRYIYLTFTQDRYPRLQVIQGTSPSPDRIYGPFPDEYFLPRLESFLGRYYGLRNCHEKNPSRICMQADLGLCLAPCAVPAGAEAYPAMLERVHDFLGGADGGILDQVEKAMTLAADQEEFEDARKHLDELHFAAGYIKRMTFTGKFTNKTCSVNDGDNYRYEFNRGDLIKIYPPHPLPEGDRYLLEESPVNDERFLLDRAYIISRWVDRHQLRIEFS